MTLEQRPATGSAAVVADEAVKAWAAIEGALAPIIGKGGVEALFNRSVSLVRTAYPNLAPVHESAANTTAFQSLRAALELQAPDDAAAANAALQLTFTDLLGQLIGHPLTARLLRHTDDIAPGGSKRNGAKP